MALLLAVTGALLPWGFTHAGPELATMQVITSVKTYNRPYEGVVEAVKQTVVAAQVAGTIVQLDVKAGDRVSAGQLLVRLDSRAAEQNLNASDAQAKSARINMELAGKDFDRQRVLYERGFISRAAFERAETEYRAATAQSTGQLALAGAAKTQSGFFVIRAPYSGIVSEVTATVGDMAMPGKPLMTLFDPTRLRVTVPLPQSVVDNLQNFDSIRIEAAEASAKKQTLTPVSSQILPAMDPGTHTALVRLGLADGVSGLVPGQFVRAWLPPGSASATVITVPARSLVRRGEMTGLYVLDGNGRPLLRQVRPGPTRGDLVEVLAGLSAGERIALDPDAAARLR